jgi:poly-gamma-glutamate capsule biosynthesis protein CapA/YwtB (metallophosphatase superfamily)
MLVAAGALGGCGSPAPDGARKLAIRPDALIRRAGTASPATAAGTIDETVITISAIGDCALGDLQHGGGAPGSLRARLGQVPDPLAYPFSGVAQLLRTDDLTIANLEGTLTEQQGANNPVFSIRGKPEYAGMLVQGGVDLVDVENNHSHDYGLEGFAETKASLERVGVGYFGGSAVDRRTIRGVRVVNLGYLGGPRGTRERVVADVQRERGQSDLVVVSFHWGVEGWTETHPDQQSLGRATIDAGADLVIGHHPHVLQGIESYRGRHILYSLGNFVFGANSQPADMDSMIVQERFRFRGGKLREVEQTVVPVRISSNRITNDFRPLVLEGAEQQRVAAKIDGLSRALRPPKIVVAAPPPGARLARAPSGG